MMVCTLGTKECVAAYRQRGDRAGELVANAAQLIAAAPGLLRALQLVVEYHVPKINPLSDAADLTARAAIAKAKGEA